MICIEKELPYDFQKKKSNNNFVQTYLFKEK